MVAKLSAKIWILALAQEYHQAGFATDTETITAFTVKLPRLFFSPFVRVKSNNSWWKISSVEWCLLMIWHSGTDSTPADSIQVTLSKEDYKKNLAGSAGGSLREDVCMRMSRHHWRDCADGCASAIQSRPLLILFKPRFLVSERKPTSVVAQSMHYSSWSYKISGMLLKWCVMPTAHKIYTPSWPRGTRLYLLSLEEISHRLPRFCAMALNPAEWQGVLPQRSRLLTINTQERVRSRMQND